MRFISFGIVATPLLLAACATKPAEIVPVAAPAHTYASYDCEQILVEARNLSEIATSSYRAQIRRVKSDKQLMVVGFFVNWPVLLLAEGDGLEAENIAILKGRMEALESASADLNQPGCKVTFTNM